MDKEARLAGTSAAEHPQALRLWLRLLTCTQLIETRIRGALRDNFAMTLPRFDLMAQLERAPDGLKMNELSRRMMVTGAMSPVSPTSLCRRTWSSVCRCLATGVPIACASRPRAAPSLPRWPMHTKPAHEAWVVDAFEALGEREQETLHRLLGKVKQHSQTRNKDTP